VRVDCVFAHCTCLGSALIFTLLSEPLRHAIKDEGRTEGERDCPAVPYIRDAKLRGCTALSQLERAGEALCPATDISRDILAAIFGSSEECLAEVNINR